MAGEIEGLCRADIGGDQQIINSMHTQHVGVTFKHILLPIWLASYAITTGVSHSGKRTDRAGRRRTAVELAEDRRAGAVPCSRCWR